MLRRLSLVTAYLYIPALYSALYWPFLAPGQSPLAISLSFPLAAGAFAIYGAGLIFVGATRRQSRVLLHSFGIALLLHLFEWLLCTFSLPGFKKGALENPLQFWTFYLAAKFAVMLTLLEIGWLLAALVRKIRRK